MSALLRGRPTTGVRVMLHTAHALGPHRVRIISAPAGLHGAPGWPGRMVQAELSLLRTLSASSRKTGQAGIRQLFLQHALDQVLDQLLDNPVLTRQILRHLAV